MTTHAKGHTSMDSRSPHAHRTYGRSRSVRLSPGCYCVPGTFYSFTVCCHDRQPQLTGETATVVLNTWREVFENLGYRVWCLVLMPGHLHGMVESLDTKNALGAVVGRAKTLSSHRVRRHTLLKWQPKFHDHILKEHEDPRTLAEYMVNNPVRAGLIEDWTQWPWTYTHDAP